MVLWLFSSLSHCKPSRQLDLWDFFPHVFLEESFKELTFVATQKQAMIIFAAETKEVLFQLKWDCFLIEAWE